MARISIWAGVRPACHKPQCQRSVYSRIYSAQGCKACEQAARAIVFDGLTAEAAAARIGAAGVGIIKRYMRNGAILPKGSLTLASAPGKTTPLIQSGRLANAISYEVIS